MKVRDSSSSAKHNRDATRCQRQTERNRNMGNEDTARVNWICSRFPINQRRVRNIKAIPACGCILALFASHHWSKGAPPPPPGLPPEGGCAPVPGFMIVCHEMPRLHSFDPLMRRVRPLARHLAVPVTISVAAALIWSYSPGLRAHFISSPAYSTHASVVPSSPPFSAASRSVSSIANDRARYSSEADAVDRRLKFLGLRVKTMVKPDGNCQFRALADQVRCVSCLLLWCNLLRFFRIASHNVTALNLCSISLCCASLVCFMFAAEAAALCMLI